VETVRGNELGPEHVGRTGTCSGGRGKFLDVVPMSSGERAVVILMREGTLREMRNRAFVDPDETIELDED